MSKSMLNDQVGESVVPHWRWWCLTGRRLCRASAAAAAASGYAWSHLELAAIRSKSKHDLEIAPFPLLVSEGVELETREREMDMNRLVCCVYIISPAVSHSTSSLSLARSHRLGWWPLCRPPPLTCCPLQCLASPFVQCAARRLRS